MALKLDILANTRQFTSEMSTAGASVDDVSSALDDMAKDGQKSGDKLEASFRDIAKSAKTAEKATSNIGTTSKKEFSKASEASSEFKGEALQNFSEVSSSFDGSMQGIGDLAQGTLGGVASSIPGIGIAAGIAAAGIGAITSTLVALQDQAKAITDGIIGDFLDMGDALDEQAVQTRVKEFLKPENVKQAELLAELLHTTVSKAALAMAGDFQAAGVTVEDTVAAIANAPGDVNYDTWIQLQNTVTATNKGLKLGKEAANDMRHAMDLKADSDLKAAKATGAVTKEVDKLGNTIYHLPNGKDILVDADTGQATYDLNSVASKTRNLPNGHISVTANTAPAIASFNALQRDLARRGITVPINVVNGRRSNAVV